MVPVATLRRRLQVGAVARQCALQQTHPVFLGLDVQWIELPGLADADPGLLEQGLAVGLFRFQTRLGLGQTARGRVPLGLGLGVAVQVTEDGPFLDVIAFLDRSDSRRSPISPPAMSITSPRGWSRPRAAMNGGVVGRVRSFAERRQLGQSVTLALRLRRS